MLSIKNKLNKLNYVRFLQIQQITEETGLYYCKLSSNSMNKYLYIKPLIFSISHPSIFNISFKF